MEKTTVTYQCPNCGAGLAFDAEKQKFACEFCLSEFTEEEAKAANPYEVLHAREEAQREFDEHMQEFECPSCGETVCFDSSLEPDDVVCPACGEKIGDVEICDGDCSACGSKLCNDEK